jgi:hypothetical protein
VSVPICSARANDSVIDGRPVGDMWRPCIKLLPAPLHLPVPFDLIILVAPTA